MITTGVKMEVSAKTMKEWQEICDLLAQTADIPAALIMRISASEIEVFVSSKSQDNPYNPGDKEKLYGSGLYCETVIKTQDKLLVSDALADENWKNNPDVKLDMISYLGFPLLFPDGKPFGTICVLDNKRNEYSENVEQLMLKFKNLIESHLEIIYINSRLGDKNRRLTDYLKELQDLRGMFSICSNCKSIRDIHGNWHPVEDYLIRHPEAEFSHGYCPECLEEICPE